jgi:hypothetical protein
MVVLPNDLSPTLMLHLDAEGRWVCDQDGLVSPIEEGGWVTTGGQRWQIGLPAAAEGTVREGTVRSLRTFSLHFRVSLDEEHTDLVLRRGEDEVAVPARKHHYLLLTLARLRDNDAQSGVGPAEAGWVAQSELAHMLRITQSQVNLQVFRARKQLAALGIEEAAALVERRVGSRQLRISDVKLHIQRG